MPNPFGLPPLPQWRGYTAANNADPAMYSMDGRWYREGQTINNGYTIGPRDAKTGQLSLLYNGGSLPISMAGSSPLPMPEIPTAEKIWKTGFMMGNKHYTEADLARMQGLNNDGELDKDIEKASGMLNANAEGYIFDNKQFGDIVKNSMMSPFMTAAQKQRIISHADWQSGITDGSIPVGVPYMVPYRTDNGEVNFQIFTREESDEL